MKQFKMKQKIKNSTLGASLLGNTSANKGIKEQDMIVKILNITKEKV